MARPTLRRQLMAVTSLLLTVVVGGSLGVLYVVNRSTARAASAAALARGLSQGAAAASVRGPVGVRLDPWRASSGGSIELVDGHDVVLWRVGRPVNISVAALEAGGAPGAARAVAPDALAAVLAVRSPSYPGRLFVAAEVPVRPTPFPSPVGVGLIVAGVVALAFAQLLWAAVASRLSHRLGRLADLTEAYARGDFHERATVESPMELARLSHAMSSMADALAAERRARETFLAEVAHDLRTPLTAMRGMLAAVAADGVGEPAASRLRAAAAETERLSRLVNDLLDLARYESGHLSVPVSRLDLREVAVLAASSAEATAGQRGLTVDVVLPDESVWVSGDLDRAAQVAVHLVDNAVRYAPRPGGRVRVSVAGGGRWRGGGDAGGPAAVGRLRVEDDGPGFDPDAASWVWSAFTRGKNARENDGGTGLGLAVGRALARAMGGDLAILGPADGFAGRVELTLPGAVRPDGGRGTGAGRSQEQ